MQTTADELRAAFDPFGAIEEVTIIHDKSTHLSKGCGFVSYSTEAAARAAIDALHDTALVPGGKPLVVKFAQGLQQRMEHKLRVTHIPADVTDEALTALFAAHGEIREMVRVAAPVPAEEGGADGDGDEGAGAGTASAAPAGAYIRFAAAEANAALAALNGQAGGPGRTAPVRRIRGDSARHAGRRRRGGGSGGRAAATAAGLRAVVGATASAPPATAAAATAAAAMEASCPPGRGTSCLSGWCRTRRRRRSSRRSSRSLAT